jgi:hypothetical protein
VFSRLLQDGAAQLFVLARIELAGPAPWPHCTQRIDSAFIE